MITLACFMVMISFVPSLAQNPDCALIVPPNPLTATGLSTPFYLQALNSANGPCHQYDPNQASFVQGAIFDVDHNTISIYNPLVIDAGTTPLTAPVVPTLPTNYVAALWFGTNADTLTLQDTHNTNSLQSGQCVPGGGNSFSIFGQFSYCNAPAFFAAVNNAINAGKFSVPHLGTAKDGQTCPTTRDFSIVDQDQSDNVITQQLQYHDSTTTIIVQDTSANRKKYTKAVEVGNGSDNRLLVDFVLPALGCKVWTVTDLADPGFPKAALPLNEIQASMFQPWPIARVPAGDPMVLDANGNYDLNKLNLYRVAVNMYAVNSVNEVSADTKNYCKHLLQQGAPRILIDQPYTHVFASPDPANTANLFDFLVMRFDQSLTNLNCMALLSIATTPLVVTVNSTSATQPLDLVIDQNILNTVDAIPNDPDDVPRPDVYGATTADSGASSSGTTFKFYYLLLLFVSLKLLF